MRVGGEQLPLLSEIIVARPDGMAVRVNLRSGIGEFGLIVRVGGWQLVQMNASCRDKGHLIFFSLITLELLSVSSSRS